MLLTRRMERAGLSPLGFVATDYVIAVWSLKEVQDMDALFAEDMLGDDLEEWMAESSMLRRTFRNVAVIAGLIEARSAGRSEEHTSELQSLMRISYAVFCLKKKTTYNQDTDYLNTSI